MRVQGGALREPRKRRYSRVHGPQPAKPEPALERQSLDEGKALSLCVTRRLTGVPNALPFAFPYRGAEFEYHGDDSF